MTRTGGGCVAERLFLSHPLALPARENGPEAASVVLTAAPPLTLLDLRCRDAGRLSEFLNGPVDLRSPAVTRVVHNERATLARLGPDWWQLRCAERAVADTVLKEANPAGVGVTDISDAFVAIGLTGAKARDVLAKAATVDLHPDVFTAGSVARTLFGRVTVIISRVDDSESLAFDMIISRSNARFLWRWLADAAREYGYTLEPAA